MRSELPRWGLSALLIEEAVFSMATKSDIEREVPCAARKQDVEGFLAHLRAYMADGREISAHF